MCRFTILNLFSFISFSAFAIEADSVFSSSYLLDTVVIANDKYVSPLHNVGPEGVGLDMQFLHRMPKILGNSDPVRYSRFLPDVQTTSEYDTGVYIQGCENSHNIISVEGVNVYNPFHLFGFFSVFNPTHFSKFELTKNLKQSVGHNRLGGMLDMKLPDEIPVRSSGYFSVGLISSQGTLRLPINKNKAIFISLRASYLNLLYSSLLKIDETTVKYSFYDVNITYLNKINERNTLWLDFYIGVDRLNLIEDTYSYRMNWGNMYGALHHKYIGNKAQIKQNIYFTGYKNELQIKLAFDAGLPFSIYDIGYNANLKLGGFDFGWHYT